MNPTTKNPLFILGYPRSGTTLLRALLGTHSQIHLVNEPELFRGLLTAGRCIPDVIEREGFPRLLEELRLVGACRQHLSTLSSERLSEFTNHTKNLSFKEVYEFLLPKPDAVTVWGEKSLGNVFYISEMLKLYPNSLFIHIVRDPRESLLSHYRKKFAHSNACRPPLNVHSIRFFTHGALLWNQWYRAVKMACESFGEHAIIQLAYRDLVTNPEKQLKQICQNLGLDYEPGMLNPSRRHTDPALMSDSAGSYAHKNLDQPINPERAEAYKELPEWASYIVESLSGPHLTELGFAPTYREASAFEKVRVYIEMIVARRKIQSRIRREIAIRRGLPVS